MRKLKNIKNYIKFVFCILLVVSLFAFSACSTVSVNIQNINKHDSKLKITATIFPPFDFARAVAGSKADVAMLIPPGTESHSYEPTPSDIIKVEQSDVFIYAGGDSDAWVDDILDSIDTSHMKIIKMVDCVKTVDEELKEGMQAERGEHEHAHEDSHEHEETEKDEHVWTSVKNSEIITRDIYDAMQEKDPNNKNYYFKNMNNYEKQLELLDNDFKNTVKNSNRKEIVFGDRFPLRYFVDEYGLDYYAAFPGCASESECSANTVAFLIDKIKKDRIPVVFHIEFSSTLIADTIANETGAEVLQFNTCHNITKKQFDDGETYVSIMRENIPALKKALK